MRLLLLAAGVLLVLALPPHARAAGDRGLAGAFMCQCGCGLTVASCTHAVCGPRDQMLAEIAKLSRAGRTPAQIRAAFVAQYGEVVLSAPIRRGFNLLAYWGPYWAIAAGALLILALGAAWVRRPKPAPDAVTRELTTEQRALLDRELDRLED